MKTILITGCSSGFGLETAKLFLERSWKVIATMRSPQENLLPASENLQIIPLDVCNEESIQKAIEAAGQIDVLVNNAGIGLLNALEGSSIKTIREIFETNTFGTIAMTQAVLPQMRQQKSGLIINVTSSVTLKSLPLLSVYTASKSAVNSFTESLALELEQFNIHVKVVLPGRSPSTQFAQNAQSKMLEIPEAYNDLAQKVFAGWSQSNEPVTNSIDVAEAVWFAVNNPSCPMYLPAGEDAVNWYKTK